MVKISKMEFLILDDRKVVEMSFLVQKIIYLIVDIYIHYIIYNKIYYNI